jgi:succinyl-CoA synthetase beta subunit
MDVHEWQAKCVLQKYGVSIPPFAVVYDRESAEKALEELELDEAVIKIQIHAGGRGKAGGVKFGHSKEEILSIVEEMIGVEYITHQTGPQGIIANSVLLSASTDIEKEYYVGAVVDRERGSPTLIISPEGGVDIEDVAVNSPEKILTEPIEKDGSVKSFRLTNILKFMGWEGDVAKQGKQVIQSLAKAFIESDGSLLEINPLVLDTKGSILAIDAKLSVDDNALFRQLEISKYYDASQGTEREARAHKSDLAYIALEGDIACMVNGAGLAMATMDIIQHYGGKPANFLDVGGGATKEKVCEAFKIILEDSEVKAILVNIFGGIMNCATIAEGIIVATEELSIPVPLIVRLEGTNVEEGRRLLEESGLSIISAKDLSDAAQKAVKAAHSSQVKL